MSLHGTFDTWYEIYKFQFNGPAGTIGNAQPGESGTGEGYTELFDISLNSFSPGLEGIHFDLFTVKGDGEYTLGELDKQLVYAVAPYSHDAEFETVTEVPEPGTLLLLGMGILLLIGFTGSRRTRMT